MRLADFIAGIEGRAKQRTWQRYLDALPVEMLRKWNDLLAQLPDTAWSALRSDILGQIDLHHPARGWRQVEDRFNEARAFLYLQKRGCTEIAFAAATMERRGPDLTAKTGDTVIACEVKTLHLNAASQLARKLATRLQDAAGQLAAIAAQERLIYLVAIDGDGKTLCDLIPTIAPADCRILLDDGDTVAALS